MLHRILLSSVLTTAIAVSFSDASAPDVLDKRLELTLVAEHPQIVTPIGCTFDQLGRLLVVESHTHLPPDDYQGPKTDRIRVLSDTDGDGRADEFSTFYDGLAQTMSMAAHDDWVYVATRREVFRIRDNDGDGRAEQRESLIALKTPGDYPHNGLGGLAFTNDGRMLFGLGENLGEPYTLVGSDGVELNGGGEGGNVYSCQCDGSQLKQIATGFWNPFGICVDSQGRIFAVGNDPDARPPCRLVHVVETGDYGYQFRFGRSGQHPLQAWNGELPGTLPMVAGTGEAPSAVIPYHGQLWVTSWGDYRIERFHLEPSGASFTAKREIVVQGDNHFRPVDFAIAPDGALVFTDWVQRSYPVHRQGRVWKLSWWSDPPRTSLPATTAGERQAAAASSRPDLAILDSTDPFLRAAAVQAIARERLYKRHVANPLPTGRQRLGMIEAARWNQVIDPLRSTIITSALADSDPEVQLYAVRWVAEKKLTAFRPLLERLVATNRTSLSLFQATVAALEWLDSGDAKNSTRADFLTRVLDQSSDYTPQFLVETLRSLPPDRLTIENTKDLVDHPDRRVQRAAIRSLVLSELEGRETLLSAVAADARRGRALRADARMGLSDKNSETRTAVDAPSTPKATDTEAWLDLLAAEPGDPDRGWRVFFGRSDSRCANCHVYQGRGADIGPDLTQVTKRLDRKRLVESILQPSREVAPRYVVTNLETTEGRLLSGLSLGAATDGETEAFIAANGEHFTLKVADIEQRSLSELSVMPDGLEKALTVGEMRDLLALLQQSD